MWTSYKSGLRLTQSGHHLTLKERQRRLLHRDYIGTTQGLLDTKPTPQTETTRMPVRVDMERLYIETFHVGIADLELSREGPGEPGDEASASY